MNTSVPGDIMNTSVPGDIMNTSVPGGIMNTSVPVGIMNTSVPGGIMNTSVPGDIMNTSVPGDIMSRLWVINTGNSDRDYTIFNTVDVIICMPTHTGSLSLQSHQKDVCQVYTQF